jgi:hypothetical protein
MLGAHVTRRRDPTGEVTELGVLVALELELALALDAQRLA